MSEHVYEASVFSKEVTYRNFRGEEKTVELFFALDPLHLMSVIAGIVPNKPVKSGNPARNGKAPEASDGDQIKFIREIATKAAGWPSDDGESFEPFEGFSQSIVGQAFLTKLTSSDGDRQEFAEKVILDPFRAFVSYAKADTSNSPTEIQQFEVLQRQMENVFKGSPAGETVEQRRARLEAEMAALDAEKTS
jgi:hypothetical protein